MLMQREMQWWQSTKHMAVTKRGRSWPGSSMRWQQTVPTFIILLPLPDNDASHLYLQRPSAICWRMAPPTRGHSEPGLAERTGPPHTDPLHDERESRPDTLSPICIYFLPTCSYALHLMPLPVTRWEGESHCGTRKMTWIFSLKNNNHSLPARKPLLRHHFEC